jgi:ketosteroid isomerase-like protein
MQQREESGTVESSVAAYAEKAYQHLCEGLATGQWQPFFDLLADEVDLIWPFPPVAGHYTGVEGRKTIAEIFSQLGGEGNRITDVTVYGKTVSTDRVVFEDHSRGEFFGRPYEGRHCIHLIMRDAQVVGFHEYTAAVA